MFEFVLEQRVFDDLVVTMIMASIVEHAFPSVAILQVSARKNFYDALRNWEALAVRHEKSSRYILASDAADALQRGL